MAGIARMRSVVLDCPDTRLLAEFYRDLLGWEINPAEYRVFLDPAGHPFCLCL